MTLACDWCDRCVLVMWFICPAHCNRVPAYRSARNLLYMHIRYHAYPTSMGAMGVIQRGPAVAVKIARAETAGGELSIHTVAPGLLLLCCKYYCFDGSLTSALFHRQQLGLVLLLILYCCASCPCCKSAKTVDASTFWGTGPAIHNAQEQT